MEEINLGAIFNNDKRNFSLEKAHELLGTVLTRPPTMLPIDIEQVYQNGYPECGAHAGVHFKEVQEKLETGKSEKFSPVFLWKQIKKIDGYSPEMGTDMQSIFKVLADKGVCKYDLLPTNYSQTLAEHTDPSTITSEMIDDAQPRIIKSYAFLTDLSAENIKLQTWLNKGLILLTRCDNGFFNTTTPTFTQRLYGHFLTIIGFNETGIFVEDSTDTKYPVKHIKDMYVNFFDQVGTAVDLPNDVVKKLIAQRGLLQNLIILWQKLLKLLGR